MRAIFYINGIFLMIMALCMVPPILADLYFHQDDWLVFFSCLVITTFFGGCLLLGNTSPQLSLTRRDTFILTITIWITLSIFGALPFYMSSLNMDGIDSFFESVSGITTTGATVISGLDHAPAGILLWRAMMQWLGGIVIILMAFTTMPYLKVGGMQVFKSEMQTDNIALPKTRQRSILILLIYMILTLLCTIGFMMAGMQVFDAAAHAMSTISTGGFSIYDHSFAHYDSIAIEAVAMVFMILGALPFVLYIAASNGNTRPLLNDTQIRTFLMIVALFCLAIFLNLALFRNMHIGEAFRMALFSTVSLITGTGFFTVDFTAWSTFCTTAFLFLMVIGGCSGSTTGGLKVFRFQILYAVIRGQLQKLLYPNSVYVPRYNGRPLDADVPLSVMSFFFAYALFFLLIALGLSFTGLDPMTALSGAIATVSNSGTGVGDVIGPGGSFEPLSDLAKIILCAGMIIGRMEIFMLLVMLSPHFWRE
jgi:trk system potassium uptake protein